MLSLGQRGVAVAPIMIVLVGVAGGAIGTPAAVDVANVDPDHPLYGLERIGERIRMVGDEDLMKERCTEFYKMWEKGKGLQYRDISEEFVEKTKNLIKKPKIAKWLKEHERMVGVATDIRDVDPDHYLYYFEKLGEQIRKIENESLMKERWSEYARLVDRGKGLQYKEILEEFREKLENIAPGDVEPEQEAVRWMQEQMPGMGLVQLKLQENLAKKLKAQLSELPEVPAEIEDEINAIEKLKEELREAAQEMPENVRAHMCLTREKLENIAKRHHARIGKPVDVFFDIDNLLTDVNGTVNVEVDMTIVTPVPIITAEFEEEREEFNELLAEVQAMLEGAPENSYGVAAAERLVKVAINLKDKAVDANEEGKIRKALALIHAAKMHLYSAKQILEHAVEWEPEFSGEWTQWREGWQEIRQWFIKEGTWESILKNWEQYAENVKQEWGRY